MCDLELFSKIWSHIMMYVLYVAMYVVIASGVCSIKISFLEIFGSTDTVATHTHACTHTLHEKSYTSKNQTVY